MYVTISKTFMQLSDEALASYELFFDKLIIAHLEKKLLLVLTPLEISKISRLVDLGPQSKRAIRVIGKRSQEYAASLSSIEYHLVVHPDQEAIVENNIGNKHIHAEKFDWWLSCIPYLFVENAVNDGRFFSYLVNKVFASIYMTPNHVFVRPYNGGGDPLGSIIENFFGDYVQGGCICDRDMCCTAPPLKSKSTADKVHKILIKLDVVDETLISNRRNPFFFFHVTHGWGVENYIGPNLLNYYLSLDHTLKAVRDLFQSAFPNFPNLNTSEMKEWSLVNFKSSKQSKDEIRIHAEKIHSIEMTDERSMLLAKLKFPDNVIKFIVSNNMVGEHAQAIASSLLMDLTDHQYMSDIQSIARKVATSFAADAKMEIS